MRVVHRKITCARRWAAGGVDPTVGPGCRVAARSIYRNDRCWGMTAVKMRAVTGVEETVIEGELTKAVLGLGKTFSLAVTISPLIFVLFLFLLLLLA